MLQPPQLRLQLRLLLLLLLLELTLVHPAVGSRRASDAGQCKQNLPYAAFVFWSAVSWVALTFCLVLRQQALLFLCWQLR